MKWTYLTFLIPLFLVFAIPNADAGISLGKGGITLPAGQSVEVCDIWIYATQEGGTYHVETTGGLKPLTVSITPNDFTLSPIDCPQETNARRACITEKCMSSDPSCKVVCIKFAAPMLIQWNTDNVIYEGGILNSIKIGVATIKEPYAFSVHVEPMDMKPVVIGISVVIVAIVILIAIFAKKRSKRKKK